MTVSETFEQFLSGLELDKSYQEIVEDRHAAVRDYLESRLPGVRTQLIGSLQRRTRIDPLTGLQDFDIDILVELFSFDDGPFRDKGSQAGTLSRASREREKTGVARGRGEPMETGRRS